MKFTWDQQKAESNIRKHGVSFQGEFIRIISCRLANKAERNIYEHG